MLKFKVEYGFNKIARGKRVMCSGEETVETDDIMTYIQNNYVAGFTYTPRTRWVYGAEQLHDDGDDYFKVKVELDGFFDGKLVLKKVSAKKVAELKMKKDEIDKAYRAALDGDEV